MLQIYSLLSLQYCCQTCQRILQPNQQRLSQICIPVSTPAAAPGSGGAGGGGRGNGGRGNGGRGGGRNGGRGGGRN